MGAGPSVTRKISPLGSLHVF